MSKVTLITTKESKPTPYRDSVLSFAMKGGDKTSATVLNFQGSLPLGKPYGIIKTTYQNPLSLTFNESTRKVYINPGVFMAYGRLCEIAEQGLVMDFASITPASTDRVFYVVYVVIDVNDAVVNSAQIKLTEPTSQPVNIDALQDQDDLYMREYGVFMMPIAQFSYSPISSGGQYFSDYSLIPEVFDEETVQIADDLLDNEDVNGTIGEALIKNIFEFSQGNMTNKFSNASNVDAEENYEALEGSYSTPEEVPGYSISEVASSFGEVGDSRQISSDLAGILTYRRIKITSIGKDFATASYSFEKEIDFDWDHVCAIKLFFNGLMLEARTIYEQKEILSFGASAWFGGSGDGVITNFDALKEPFGLTGIEDRSANELVFVLYGVLRRPIGESHKSDLHFEQAYWDEEAQRYRANGMVSYQELIDLIGIPIAAFDIGSTCYLIMKITKTGNGKRAKIKMEGVGDSGWLYRWGGGLDFSYCDYQPLRVDKASGSMWIELQYEGAAFND